MKRLQAVLLVAFSSTLLLFGCGKKKEASNTVVTPAIEETQSKEDENTDTQQENQDQPSREGMVRSRITNEWIDEDKADQRPIAIMIPNSKTATQYELSKASVLYECNVEGSMTRLMAIFEDWNDMEKIGNIRSCRDYFMYWSFEWDAICIHYGGPYYIDDIVNREDTQNINCLIYTDASFTDSAKNDTDNAFTSGKRIKDAMEHYGYSAKYREGYSDSSHFVFADDNQPNTLEQYEDAVTASKVDLSLSYPVTNCYFIYNEETGLYERFQHLSGGSDGPHVDDADNTQLTFKNLLIQNTYYEVRDDKGYLAFRCHDTMQDGWFFTNGKGIHVTWKKETDYGATRYYDDDGNEVQLNTGKTMICIVENGDSFSIDNKIIELKSTETR